MSGRCQRTWGPAWGEPDYQCTLDDGHDGDHKPGELELAEGGDKSLEALRAVKALEWQRSDWQGLCVFRQFVGCTGTDGRVAAVGTPHPRPHVEHCPMRLVTAALAEVCRG